MSDAQAADAADQMGHRLGAEADNATDEHESTVKRWMSEAWHEFSQRLQGHDPAQLKAEAQAAAEAGGGLSVEKTEGEVPADASGDTTGASERLDVVKETDPTAGQAATTTGGEGTAGAPAGSSPAQPEHPGVP